MPKIVILGSCRFEPYLILFVPHKVSPPELYNTPEGYAKISKLIHGAIDNTDEVWVYAPDGVGEHTGKDLEYAKLMKKEVRIINFDKFLTAMDKRVEDKQFEYGDSWKTLTIEFLRYRLGENFNEWLNADRKDTKTEKRKLVDLANLCRFLWRRISKKEKAAI